MTERRPAHSRARAFQDVLRREGMARSNRAGIRGIKVNIDKMREKIAFLSPDNYGKVAKEIDALEELYFQLDYEQRIIDEGVRLEYNQRAIEFNEELGERGQAPVKTLDERDEENRKFWEDLDRQVKDVEHSREI